MGLYWGYVGLYWGDIGLYWGHIGIMPETTLQGLGFQCLYFWHPPPHHRGIPVHSGAMAIPDWCVCVCVCVFFFLFVSNLVEVLTTRWFEGEK